MDPIYLYLFLFFAAVGLCLMATTLARKPQRACAQCGHDTPIDGRSCRHCGDRPGRV